ncbi:hypothetical protein [uncultured Fibrobacter sp.]|uniref:hypothetical protein n=1 Tax=uncultured Fibrobacter sp. TaxID=261512 RepID=UPI002639E06C|nr:hypothetical protein [uncultured Fibrobacter sp.]
MKINLSFDTDDAKDRKLLRALLDELCPGVVKDDSENEPEVPARPEPDLSAWTADGKTHEQMLKEKMAMHNGFPMPEAQPKRRGRKPKAAKGDA